MGLTRREKLKGEDVLAAIKTVDGEASGLDADLLDGNHADELVSEAVQQASENTARDYYDKAYIDNAGKIVDAHTSNTIVHITEAERTSWNAKADLVDGKVPAAQLPENIGGGVIVDSALSTTSENPVQNKVLAEKLASFAVDLIGCKQANEDTNKTINQLNEYIGLNYYDMSYIDEAQEQIAGHILDRNSHITADERTSWNSKADLVDGKVPTEQLPELSGGGVICGTYTGNGNQYSAILRGVAKGTTYAEIPTGLTFNGGKNISLGARPKLLIISRADISVDLSKISGSLSNRAISDTLHTFVAGENANRRYFVYSSTEATTNYNYSFYSLIAFTATGFCVGHNPLERGVGTTASKYITVDPNAAGVLYNYFAFV